VFATGVADEWSSLIGTLSVSSIVVVFTLYPSSRNWPIRFAGGAVVGENSGVTSN
jgi:hypothetical protein